MRCQFCKHQFISAGHYGRHLRTYHLRKELNYSSWPKTPLLDLQDMSGTIKRCRMNSPKGSNRVASKPTATGNLSIEKCTPNRRGTFPDPLNPDRPTDQRLPQSLQVGQVIRKSFFTHIRDPSWNPLLPFANAYNYKLARFFHQSKTSMKQID